MSVNKDSKKLLIITGPQGSGNHLFSKVFALHSDVTGWNFGDKYWIPSDEEPFADCWVDPSKTKQMLKHNLMVANVSVPFVYDGVKTIPAIQEVVYEAEDAGYDVTVCIICRDRNINSLQQARVRGEITLPTAMQYFMNLDAKFAFISHETLYLHKGMYLKWLSKTLDFPIAYDDSRIDYILASDQNSKYVDYVEEHWLDEHVWNGIRPKLERR
jgi:hypothetical protein